VAALQSRQRGRSSESRHDKFTRPAHAHPIAKGVRRCACVRARARGMGGRPGAGQRRGRQGASEARAQTGGRHAGARRGPTANGDWPGWRSRNRIGSCSSHFRSSFCGRSRGASVGGQDSRARAEACTGEQGSQPVRRGRHGACGDVGGTERARCGSEYWRRWIASRVLVAAGQGRRRGRKGTAAGGGGAPNNGRRSGSRMSISRLLRGWRGHAQRRPGAGARGWVSECRGQARFGCEPSPLRRHRDRRDGCDGGRLPRVERRGE
jgi:hypothetical protein